MYCVVDTHFTVEMGDMIRSEWGGDVYISCGTANSRGGRGVDRTFGSGCNT